MPRLGGALALGLVGALTLVAAGHTHGGADPSGRRTIMLGRSVDGRPITAVEIGDFDAPRRTLVVGCIHGNETAGIAVANRLAHGLPPRELDLWIIPDLNPDGATADSRDNTRGVDLNRNFPWRWRPLGGIFFSGPRPLSEPESRIAYHLIRRIGPRVSIWFHQHLDVVDESGGSVALERRFARLTGLPFARLTPSPAVRSGGRTIGSPPPRRSSSSSRPEPSTPRLSAVSHEQWSRSRSSREHAPASAAAALFRFACAGKEIGDQSAGVRIQGDDDG